MSDLISRQDAIEAFYTEDCWNTKPKEILESLPSAQGDAPKPTGDWEYNSLSDKWRCNQCFQSNDKKSNFCPNCGADMRGEEE